MSKAGASAGLVVPVVKARKKREESIMGKINWRGIGAGLIVPIVLIAIWQAVCVLGWVSPLKLPSPLAIGQRWVQYITPAEAYSGSGWLRWVFSGELIRDAMGSMYRVLIGF